MDFEMYNEEKMEQARLLKLIKIIQQDFEYAANMRDVEKDCQTYLKFKKHHGFKKSTFVIIEGFLIYANFGTAINDQLITEFLSQQNEYKNLEVRYLIRCLNNDD